MFDLIIDLNTGDVVSVRRHFEHVRENSSYPYYLIVQVSDGDEDLDDYEYYFTTYIYNRNLPEYRYTVDTSGILTPETISEIISEPSRYIINISKTNIVDKYA